MENCFTIQLEDGRVTISKDVQRFSKVFLFDMKLPQIRVNVFAPIKKYLEYLCTKEQLPIDEKKQYLIKKYEKEYPFTPPNPNDVFVCDGKLHKFINDEFENEFVRSLDYSEINEISKIIELLKFQRMKLLIGEFMIYEKINFGDHFYTFRNIFLAMTLTTKNFYKSAITLCMKNKLDGSLSDYSGSEILDGLENKHFFSTFINHTKWSSENFSEMMKQVRGMHPNLFYGFFILCSISKRFANRWYEKNTLFDDFEETLLYMKYSGYEKFFETFYMNILGKDVEFLSSRSVLFYKTDLIKTDFFKTYIIKNKEKIKKIFRNKFIPFHLRN